MTLERAEDDSEEKAAPSASVKRHDAFLDAQS
jgi:hypothetical protein